jgi:uncharacterized protein YggU (UPF0235/DUF167 family)
LRVSVAAPPIGGRANAACRRALAEALGVPEVAVEVAAARSRRKRVRVEAEPGALEARLRKLAARGEETG